MVQRNYLEVYPYERWSDKEIPDYESVLEFEPSSVDLHQGQTQPPPLLTEADLIALMDKHGIGTDATHAEHIETVSGGPEWPDGQGQKMPRFGQKSYQQYINYPRKNAKSSFIAFSLTNKKTKKIPVWYQTIPSGNTGLSHGWGSWNDSCSVWFFSAFLSKGLSKRLLAGL